MIESGIATVNNCITEYWVSRKKEEEERETEGAQARLDWDSYFLKIAQQVATRSTCDRKHVGAVIVRDRAILSTGYNGSMRGTPHCDDHGHIMEEGHCIRTIHAEVNAVIQAAKNGTAINDAAVYVTALPCWSCFKTLVNAGITKIVYNEEYRAEHMTRMQSTCFGLNIVLLKRDLAR